MPETLSFLDRQFRFSAILPDFQTWLDWMAAQDGPSVWTRHQTGPHARQTVDLTPGAGAGDAPTLLFIHGGYWRAQEVERYRFVAKGAAALGGPVALAEYRLMPEVPLEDVIRDAVAALETTAALVPDRPILIVGHSAGGHLAHYAAERARLPVGRLAGVVPISGLFDLAPLAESFLQSETGLTPEDVAQRSPLTGPFRRDLRRHVLVGEVETGLYHQQAAAYAHRTGAGLSTVERAHHMSVLAGLADPHSGLSRALAAIAAGTDVPALVAAPPL